MNKKIVVGSLLIVFMIIAAAIIPIAAISTKTTVDDETEYWGVVIEVWAPKNDPHPEYLYEALLSTNMWNSSHLIYLGWENATKDNILDALDWLANRSSENDMVLFAFQGDGNANYLAPWMVFFPWDAISAKELKTKLDVINCQGMCIILNSCKSGIFGNKVAGENRVVLKSTFRRGDGAAGFSDNEWFDFSDFIADAISSKIDPNNDHICSAEEALRYARRQFRPWLTPDFILRGIIAFPTMRDNYEGEFPLVVL